jgi:hypothetical protein
MVSCLLEGVTAWISAQPDVQAAAPVGSYCHFTHKLDYPQFW